MGGPPDRPRSVIAVVVHRLKKRIANDVLSVRPKVAQLTFSLFERTLHPELFVIQSSRDFDRAAYRAHVDITNCGHVIRVQTDQGTLTEVAAGQHQPLPAGRRMLSQPLAGSRTEEVQSLVGLTYRTHFQLETVGPEMFWMVGQQLGKQPTEGLLHNFDASGRMALGAVSYLNVETRSRSLLIQAIHTFPDDHAIVKIESLFTVTS